MFQNQPNIAKFIDQIYNQEFNKDWSNRLLGLKTQIEADLARHFVDPKYHSYLFEAFNVINCFKRYAKSYNLTRDDLGLVILWYCNRSSAFCNAMMWFYGVQKLYKYWKPSRLDDAILYANNNSLIF